MSDTETEHSPERTLYAEIDPMKLQVEQTAPLTILNGYLETVRTITPGTRETWDNALLREGYKRTCDWYSDLGGFLMATVVRA